MTVGLALDANGALQVRDASDPVELWTATRRFYLARRSETPGGDLSTTSYPETTNRDAHELLQLWHRQLRTYWRADLAPTMSGRSRADWTAELHALDLAVFGKPPTDTYRHNAKLWKLTKGLSVALSVMRDQPSLGELRRAALKHAIRSIPSGVARLLDDVADGVSTVAEKAGGVVASPVRGLFGGLFGDLGRPLLIGAAVIGAAIVVPRLMGPRAGSERERVP